MGRLILLLAALALAGGCASITYTAPDGSRATYWRVGDTDLEGVEVSLPGGGVVKIRKAASQAEALNTLAGTVHDLAALAAKGAGAP